MRTYYAISGDNLRQIGKMHKRDPVALAKLNNREIDEELSAGEAILLPPADACACASCIREGALSINGFLGEGVSEKALADALPYLSTITIEGGCYSKKDGLRLPHTPHDALLVEGAIPRLLLPYIGREALSSLGTSCPLLAADGYRGLVLSLASYPTEELTSALPQLSKIFKNNDLALFALIPEGELNKRPKLWIYLSEIVDGIFTMADDIKTAWERRLAFLNEDFPRAVLRRIYTELPYALLCCKGTSRHYLPLNTLGEQIKKSHAKRGNGSHEWNGDGCQFFGEDPGSISLALTRLARIGLPGASLHLGHTPEWILSLIRSRFACQVRCQRNDRRSPW